MARIMMVNMELYSYKSDESLGMEVRLYIVNIEFYSDKSDESPGMEVHLCTHTNQHHPKKELVLRQREERWLVDNAKA